MPQGWVTLAAAVCIFRSRLYQCRDRKFLISLQKCNCPMQNPHWCERAFNSNLGPLQCEAFTFLTEPLPLLSKNVFQMYDSLMKTEPISDSNEETFWAEFFLLKPKISYLENEISKLTSEQLFAGSLRSNLNRLFEESLLNLGSDHHIRWDLRRIL